MSKKNMGSSIDDFMKEEGIFEKAQAQAIKEVVVWQTRSVDGDTEKLRDPFAP